MPQSELSPALARVAERFRNKLPQYLDDIDEIAGELSPEADISVFENAKSMVHNLAGTAAPLGFPELGAHARDTDTVIRAMIKGDSPRTPENVETARDMLLQVRASAEAPGADGSS